MGGFRDLDEFLAVEPKVLPIRGKDYTFPPSISARSWLVLQDFAEKAQRASKATADGEEVDLDDVVIPDDVEDSLKEELLGDAEQEMIDDGLTSDHVRAVFMTLTAWHLQGREAAEMVWNRQGEVGAPNREARRRRNPAKSPRLRGSHDGSTGPSKKARPGATSSKAGA